MTITHFKTLLLYFTFSKSVEATIFYTKAGRLV